MQMGTDVLTSLKTRSLSCKHNSSVETMSSSTSGVFDTAESGVFWDLDDCPIPDDQTPASISANIRSALKNAGYVGVVSIVAYSLAKQTSVAFESVKIKLVHPGGRNEKYHIMYSDVFTWAMEHLYGPSNLMIISKDVIEDFDYVKVLTLIKKQHNNIILALPCDPSEEVRSTASSLWLWADLSTSGIPLNIQSVTPFPTSSSSSGRSLRPTGNKQMKRGCQKKRKISSNTKFEK